MKAVSEPLTPQLNPRSSPPLQIQDLGSLFLVISPASTPVAKARAEGSGEQRGSKWTLGSEPPRQPCSRVPSRWSNLGGKEEKDRRERMQGQEKLQAPSSHLCILRCFSIISVGPVHKLHLTVTAPLPPPHILSLQKERTQALRVVPKR